MFHEGQLEGRRVRLPVFLGRRPEEPVDEELRDFYTKLLLAINSSIFRKGDWSLCDRTGWPDNASFENIVAWSWNGDGDRYLIVVNLSGAVAQAHVQVSWDDLKGKHWRLTDLLSGAVYERDGDEVLSPGLYVDLQPWGCHFLRSSELGSKAQDNQEPRQKHQLVAHGC
jgi:hypothetical protein